MTTSAPNSELYSCAHATFHGHQMTQTWADLMLYERVLNAHPRLRCIIELGTGTGGFSHFLYGQTRERGWTFHTFDVEETPLAPQAKAADILNNPAEVYAFMSHPLLLVCDNGDKPREIELYAPLLVKGDLLAVHDWGAEVFESDIPKGLRLIHGEWSESMTRFFAKED